jgi:solute carrier family 25 protein 42
MDTFHRSFERLFAMESFIQDELKTHGVIASLFCGSIAGMVAKTAIAPAERVKMSFQVSSDKFSYPAAYRRAIAMVRADGVLGLWKGGSTTLLRVAPFAGISYAAHDYAEKSMKLYFGVNQLTFGWKFLAGSISGAAGTVSTYPLDVLRVRLALTPVSMSRLLSVVSNVYTFCAQGLTYRAAFEQGAFYQGLLPTLLGIIPYSGTAWCVKQSISEFFPTMFHRKQTTSELLISNAFAGYAVVVLFRSTTLICCAFCVFRPHISRY